MRSTLLDPGSLNRFFDLEERLYVSDTQGGYNEIWQVVASIWARMEPISTALNETSNHVETVAKFRITIRYRAGIKAGQRFSKNGRLFVISTVVDPDERQRYLICICKEEKS